MFLYGELSVVISAMAVCMDLKDASVDNGWILFSFMIGFLIQITENGPKGGVIFWQEWPCRCFFWESFLYSI